MVEEGVYAGYIEWTRVTIYSENILHDRSDIGEYRAPNRVEPRANCSSFPPCWQP